jgi:hypothetical protein
MKIALLEVSHWHFPLYIKHLLDSGVDIVGWSDETEVVRNNIVANWVVDRITAGGSY